MAQKLVKINQDHYVVVDDSEITQPCYVYKSHENVHGRGIFYLPTDTDFVAFNKEAKDISVITHSTKPLEIIKGIGENSSINYYYGTDRLSLQEVKELIGEVDVEKKALAFAEAESYGKLNGDLWKGFLFGYNQALEDNKEKKYTEEDLRKVFDAARRCITMPIGGAKHQYYDEYSVSDFDEYKREILSAHTPTEWEIQIVDGKLKLKL